eukprot:UN00358
MRYNITFKERMAMFVFIVLTNACLIPACLHVCKNESTFVCSNTIFAILTSCFTICVKLSVTGFNFK